MIFMMEQNQELINNFKAKYQIKETFSLSTNYLQIRLKQNVQHAQERTKEGIRARDSEKIKIFDSALELDPSCIEALVLRGVELYKKRKLKQASKDLKLALRMEPSNHVAKQTLEKIKQVQRREKEYSKGLLRGEFLMDY
jgi:hypothetical protein